MASITVIGAGYVGLVTAGCFAEMGHRVACVEAADERVQTLSRGELPIHEPGLAEIWQRHLASGALTITGDYEEGVRDCDFIFICVGSPSRSDGSADLAQVLSAARSISSCLRGNAIIVVKSTVPVGTAAALERVVNAGALPGNLAPVVSNPEFLRESDAVKDFLNPDRVIIGSADTAAADAVAALYEPLTSRFVFCDNGTAEMIKYASNAFLATKISFINEVASICEPLGIDIAGVANGVGLDRRIGPHFLAAGLGWGGSCLPKDTSALLSMARDVGRSAPLLSAVVDVNSSQPQAVVQKLKTLLGPLDERTVTVWGLTFKPQTDDLRDSPALKLVELLDSYGCGVRVYDPMARAGSVSHMARVTVCGDPYEAARESDAVILATAWTEFLTADMPRVREEMRGRVFIDARNALEPGQLRDLGFLYLGIGRDWVGRGEDLEVDGRVVNGRVPKRGLAAVAVGDPATADKSRNGHTPIG